MNLLLFSYVHGAITLVLVIFIIIVVYLIVKGINHPEFPGFWGEYFGETLSSTNLFTKVPAKKISKKNAGNIIISAHIDSKSQSMNTFWRVVLYKITFYSGIMLLGVYTLYFIILFGNLDVPFYFTIYGGWISIILISFSNLCLLFLNTHNKSPGALDNASGMAIVFELSSYFIENPLDNFNIWFCQFSAEELGTMGARVFVDEHENLFKKGKAFQINFDMVSCKNHKNNQIEYIQSYGIGMHKIYSPILNKYILLAAKEKNIKIKKLHASTGAHSDTVPFRLRKYDAVDIANEAAIRYTHTVKDTPDKVDPKILFDACILFRETIKLMDTNFEKISKYQDI
ncbi:MAG: M28 family metallopeptidase [Candidatus Hermodarchaeota archaeon]